MAVRQSPSRLILIARQAEALSSGMVRVGGGSGASRESNRGEFEVGEWVRSSDVVPLSCGVSVGVVSAPVRSVGMIEERSGSGKLFKLCVDIILHLQNLFN